MRPAVDPQIAMTVGGNGADRFGIESKGIWKDRFMLVVEHEQTQGPDAEPGTAGRFVAQVSPRNSSCLPGFPDPHKPRLIGLTAVRMSDLDLPFFAFGIDIILLLTLYRLRRK